MHTFPITKLNSEINARFLSNGHGDLYFLIPICCVRIILYKLRVQKHFGKENDIPYLPV